MSVSAFEEVLHRLERRCDAGSVAASDVADDLHKLSTNRPLEIPANALTRLIRLCYRLTGLDEPAVELDASGTPQALDAIGWMVESLIKDTLTDRGARNRAFIEGQVSRIVALGRAVRPESRRHYIPRYSIPLTAAEAGPLLAPFLRTLERRMQQDPFAHLPLCWNVLEHPLPPFEQVFRDWLADLDRRGVAGGGHLLALDRARALEAMAKAGRQRLSWEEIETALMPEFETAHPMVAATLARFIGSLYADGGGRIRKGPALPLEHMMARISGLERNRRQVAGGFLDGFADGGDPLSRLRNESGTSDAAVDDWVLAVFADGQPEPYLPGAQAFWFFVHEHYWASPDFVLRLIEAGHLWEAMMCATEGPLEDSGMSLVLRRLAECEDEEVALRARAVLSGAQGH